MLNKISIQLLSNPAIASVYNINFSSSFAAAYVQKYLSLERID